MASIDHHPNYKQHTDSKTVSEGKGIRQRQRQDQLSSPTYRPHDKTNPFYATQVW